MPQIYRSVVGNNSPNLVFTCKRNDTAINVTGSTVTLTIRNERTGSTSVSNGPCDLTTPASGIVTYLATTADYPREGRYIGDVKIVHGTGKIEWLHELLLMIARPANS